MRKIKGFTIIELLIVMAILGALSVVVVVSFKSSQARARDAQRKSDIKEYASSLEKYANLNSDKYPQHIVEVSISQLCIDLGLLGESCPNDPKVGVSPFGYFYQTNDGGCIDSEPCADRYTLRGELEGEANIWVFCSIGSSGTVPQSTPFSDGSCPSAIAGASPTPTPLATSTPVPTATPVAPTPTPTPGGVISHLSTITGGSTSSTTVSTSTFVSAVAGGVYIAGISIRPNISVSSVSGLGLAWSLVTPQCSGRAQTRVEVWRGQGTAASGFVTASLSGTPVNAVIAVSTYSGAGSIGSVVSANTNGVSGGCSLGVDSISYSVSITPTVSNSLIYGVVAKRGTTHTPGSGYTERAEVAQGSAGEIAGEAVEDKLSTSVSPTTLNGSLSSTVDWALVGLEIKP
ncbi:type II secretion system protein [Candidatus Woesebacteria bacterium]|nr:type II secretion system protein [Candidatus Woesebacteria bacterium]